MVMLNAQNAQSENDFSGHTRVDAGLYHVAVNACHEKASKTKATPGVEIEFQILCDGIGTDKKTPVTGQVGKTISAFFAAVGENDDNTQRCLNNLTRLALVTGLLKPGMAAEPDWEEATGRELVIFVKEDQKATTDQAGNKVWNKTGYTSVDWFGFWSLGNKEVVNVPKDPTTPGMQQLAASGEPTASTASSGAATATAKGNGVAAGNGTTKKTLRDL